MDKQQYNKLKRCACANLRGTARALTQFYDERLRSTGLRTTQFTVLVNIARFGPITVTELASKLLMDQTTLTHNLQPLQKEGLVTRVKGEQDQRTRLLTITEAGDKILDEALPIWEQAQAHIVDGLGQERFYALLKELSAVNALLR